MAHRRLARCVAELAYLNLAQVYACARAHSRACALTCTCTPACAQALACTPHVHMCMRAWHTHQTPFSQKAFAPVCRFDPAVDCADARTQVPTADSGPIQNCRPLFQPHVKRIVAASFLKCCHNNQYVCCNKHYVVIVAAPLKSLKCCNDNYRVVIMLL